MTKPLTIDEVVSRVETWPDLSRDQQAWNEAKLWLGPNAVLSKLVWLAQRIKEKL